MNQLTKLVLTYSAMVDATQRAETILSLHATYGMARTQKEFTKLYHKGYIDNHTPLALITQAGQQKLKTQILREKEAEKQYIKKLQELVLTQGT